MRFIDAYRGQYFIKQIYESLDLVIREYSQESYFKKPVKEVITPFIESLAVELDQILLPAIAHEIAKERSSLVGKTPEERYDSFFVHNGKFTAKAKSFAVSYAFLLEYVDHTITSSFSNLKTCFSRLKQDMNSLFLNKLLGSKEPQLIEVQSIVGSDRHRNTQTLMLTFADGAKVIYKPTDLRPDFLYSKFIDFLELPKPYNLKYMRTLPKKMYGWIEFIPHLICENVKDIEKFFLRAGALLAVADALNYTDGHCENLIAMGDYPILLDGETFFQNYAMPVAKQKNILSTMLIQKTDKCLDNKLPYSAFQSPAIEKIEALYTYPIEDHTDRLKVKFRGATNKKNQNCPRIKNKYFTADQYVTQVIQGYAQTYDHLTKHSQRILEQAEWWNEVSQVHSRSVIRETAAYAYLLRRIQQPDKSVSKINAKRFMEKKLEKSPYQKYEVEDLLVGNIPYFYHIPGKKHFYDGRNFCYKDTFEKNAIDSIRKEFCNRSEQKKNFDCKIIKRHLRKK